MAWNGKRSFSSYDVESLVEVRMDMFGECISQL